MADLKEPAPGPRSAGTRKESLAYVDNFRSSLTALVILHHTATSYGGIGRNVYQASQFGQATSPVLTGFNAINHSFFMSTFMYLGGHFSRKALQRKPKGQYVRDRLYRLGLPTVAYTLIGAPLCLAMREAWLWKRPVGWKFWIDYWKTVRGVAGPVWFTATLLTFDLSMAALDKLWKILGLSWPTKSVTKKDAEHRVRNFYLLGTLGLCSAAEFFVRLAHPVGRVVPPLKIQLGNVPPYVAAYVFGAFNDNVEDVMPDAIGTSVCLLVSATSSVLLPSSLLNGETWTGGWNKAAASFAIWGNFTGYLIGSQLLDVFSKTCRAPWTWINRYSYPAFLVHLPIVTFLGVATDNWRGSSIQKTALVGSAAVGLSWLGGCMASQLWSLVSGV